MRPVLLTPMYYGKQCTVLMPNGKEYKRVVRYCKQGGLYIVVATKKYFEFEMEYDDRIWKEN